MYIARKTIAHGIVTSTTFNKPRKLPNNNSIDFDGTNDYIDIGSSPELTDIFTNGGSFSIWFKPTVNTSHGIISKRGSGNGGWRFRITDHSGGKGRLYFTIDFDGGSNYTTNQSSRDIISGEWYHVYLSYNSGSTSNRVTIYLNGELVTNMSTTMAGTTTPTGSVRTDASDSPFLIGADNQFEFLGNIHEVAVWDRILKYQEHNLIYNKPGLNLKRSSGTYSSNGLIAYYRLGHNTTFPYILDEKFIFPLISSI